MITREECERRILDKLDEIEAIAKEYDPNTEYLSMFIRSERNYVNNDYWNEHPAIDNYRNKEV